MSWKISPIRRRGERYWGKMSGVNGEFQLAGDRDHNGREELGVVDVRPNNECRSPLEPGAIVVGEIGKDHVAAINDASGW